ncbi:hypothetical protein AXG93_40s1220 [Marchantia polymorpha subsp. ruderalis]|uniref:Cytochrome P450 n=1 Tax=Marchantia polymorpha subsp. ruderalis TaxID=1480154 RepID=A0A176WCC7_MARPO|nr:hypothetical protein AXG93_40s1220 [Marchantia polymorpha subsp. ruderalis]
MTELLRHPNIMERLQSELDDVIDPKVWGNPLKFDPSRFLNSRIDVKGQHYEILPFSSGRRLCPGMNLALVSVAYTLAQLVHACSISLPEGLTPLDVDVEQRFGITVGKRNPLNLLLTRRLPSDVYQIQSVLGTTTILYV